MTSKIIHSTYDIPAIIGGGVKRKVKLSIVKNDNGDVWIEKISSGKNDGSSVRMTYPANNAEQSQLTHENEGIIYTETVNYEFSRDRYHVLPLAKALLENIKNGESFAHEDGRKLSSRIELQLAACKSGTDSKMMQQESDWQYAHGLKMGSPFSRL